MKQQHNLKAAKLRKICISGTANTGKSTLINDMCKHWSVFSTPEKTYRDIIKEKNLVINKEGNEESQEVIHNTLIDMVMANYKTKMVFDRCPLDSLVYTIWLNAKGKVSDKFVDKQIDLCRESLKFLDCIFFIPLTEVHKIPIVKDELRDTDENYINEIDNIFKALIDTRNTPITKFFPQYDCPPVIEIFGDRETRIKMLELYIDAKGEFIGVSDDVFSNLVDGSGNPLQGTTY